MLKIIITGPESSGKTTLTKAVAEHFDLSFTKEYAREYLENLNQKYRQNDLLKIAKCQLKSEEGVQLLDTDLITIKIWSNYKYGNCSNWILKKIQAQRKEKRFYLLCKPDIPWVADPLRETPNNRKYLFNLYIKELEQLQHNYSIIEGEHREKKSISKITSLIY